MFTPGFDSMEWCAEATHAPGLSVRRGGTSTDKSRVLVFTRLVLLALIPEVLGAPAAAASFHLQHQNPDPRQSPLPANRMNGPFELPERSSPHISRPECVREHEHTCHASSVCRARPHSPFSSHRPGPCESRREVPQFGCAVTWQHRINSYTPWADFDAEVSSLVERGYGEGLQYVEFSFGMKSYKVCFDDMTQRATNSRRYVRRFLQVPGFLRLTRHPLVSEMRVATAACSIHSFPRLPEEVRARYEALEDRYYELLGGARTEIALFPVPAPRLAEVEEADVHSVVAAASMALWRLRPCPGVAGSPPPVFLCEASYREGFEELFRRVAGDAPPAAVEEGGGWMSDFIISAIGKAMLGVAIGSDWGDLWTRSTEGGSTGGQQ